MSIVPVVILTKDEARACVKRINARIDDIRADVLRLHEGEGWRSLGYESWRECVTTEFGGSERRLYQLLDAARIEQAISATSTVDTSSDATLCNIVQSVASDKIPDSVLRPLKPLLNDPETLRETWAAAKEEYGPEPTAAQVATKVAEKLPPKVQARYCNYCRTKHGDWTPMDSGSDLERCGLCGKESLRSNAVSTPDQIYIPTSPLGRAAQHYIDTARPPDQPQEPRKPLLSEMSAEPFVAARSGVEKTEEQELYWKVLKALRTATDESAEEWVADAITLGRMDVVETRLALAAEWVGRVDAELKRRKARPVGLVARGGNG